jgi:Skp family chaperone for outer membrane proteins
MNRMLISIALAAVMAMSILTAMLPPAAVAQQNVPGATSDVAVCDIVGVFYEYDDAVTLGAEIQAEQERLQAEFEDRQEAVIALEQELDELSDVSPQYETAYRNFHRERLELIAWMEYNQAVLYRQQLEQTLGIYQDILRAVAAVAQREGYSLVFFRGDPNVPVETIEDLLGQMRDRRVLYHDPNIDITQDVLLLLNRPE